MDTVCGKNLTSANSGIRLKFKMYPIVGINMDVYWVTHIPGCPKKFNEARTTFCGKSLETIISKVFLEIFGVNVA